MCLNKHTPIKIKNCHYRQFFIFIRNIFRGQIEFYRYDGNDCLAVVDGEAVSLVERSYVVDLVEAVNAIVLN